MAEVAAAAGDPKPGPIVRAIEISKSYGNLEALDGVSLDICPDELGAGRRQRRWPSSP